MSVNKVKATLRCGRVCWKVVGDLTSERAGEQSENSEEEVEGNRLITWCFILKGRADRKRAALIYVACTRPLTERY